MGRESTQNKLGRVRPPRVQITYDVEVGGATETKELPFVVGVLGDFTGQPKEQQPQMKDRSFVEISTDNFDKVLSGMKPHLAFSVENKLTNEGQLKVDLTFEKMADFEPEQIVKKVGPLNDLLTLRTKLADLRGSLQGNDELDSQLLDIVKNTEKQTRLRAELEKKGEGESNG